MVTLGFYCYGNYYSKENSTDGHIEIARRILERKPSWLAAFNENTRYRDPVDFLIFCKGAIKIGSRFGMKTVIYSSRNLDKEMQTILMEYKNKGWKLEDVYLLTISL